MSSSLQTLSLQESELVELRETIEVLKTQNTDAQTAIQVALNGPDHLHKGRGRELRGGGGVDAGPRLKHLVFVGFF